MIGLDTLEGHLAHMTDGQRTAWLDGGLREVAGRDFSEGAELAFSPLLLSPDEPPMQQFHVAFDAMRGRIQAGLMHSCGELLSSLRESESADYYQALFSLAASFRPHFGLFSATRTILSMFRAGQIGSDEIDRVIDPIVSSILGYSSTADLLNLIEELKGEDLWRPHHSEQLAIFVVRNAGLDWPAALESIEDDLRPLVEDRPFFWKRLASQIGPFGLKSGHSTLFCDPERNWLHDAIYQGNVSYRGTPGQTEDGIVIVLHGKPTVLPTENGPAPSIEDVRAALPLYEAASSPDEQMNELKEILSSSLTRNA